MTNLHYEHLALMYNNVSDMIFLVEIEEDGFRCVNVNNAYLMATGLQRNNIINQMIDEFLPPETYAFVSIKYKEAIAAKETITYEETVTLPKGKSTIEITLHPIYDNDRCRYLLGVSKDVTQRKLEEEMYLRAEKLSIVGQLAAGVAHEIRNPLTSIKGFLKLMEARIEADDKTSSYMDIMSSELGRIEEIINEFLILAKPQKPKLESTDVKILVNEVVQLLTTQANLIGIEFEVIMPKNLPSICCDKNLIKQVLINIIQNAMDASPTGEKIVIKVSVDDEHIHFQVIDRGHGITSERLERLGEPFYSTKEKGTGLGLMICQQIIDKHEGKIIINSNLNKGTTVDVSLPL